MKTKFAFTNSTVFTIFLITGLIALIQGAPVFAQSFGSPTNYTVGSNPYDGALGDFNGDGKPDLAVANNSTSNISVLLGNGDGTFGVKTDYDVGQPAYGVVITDLNSDGKLDIVAATSFSLTEGVSVLLGNGNGTFQTHVDYLFPGLAQPNSILASDFNNDTKPDIVVINGSGASVLLGNGDGTLKPPVSYGSSDFATSVAVGDFNADGKIDLAVSSYGSGSNGVVSIMLGKGDGTFFPSVDFSTAISPFSIVKGDFNGDTKLDLATANLQVDTVSVLLGNGDGTFGAPVNYGTAGFPYELSIGDLNGDGKSDLVVAANGSGLSVLKGNGDGTFQKSVNFSGGGNFATVLDLNGDAKPDVISAAAAANSVAVFINQTGPHNITGTVRDNNNAPLSNVRVVLTGGTPVIITTDATGTFAFNDLTAGQTYTVTPSRTNYTFAPLNQNFNNLTSNVVANFTGTLNHYSISGTVRDISGAGMAGVTMTLSGSMSGTITTGADGAYAFTNLPGGGNYTVTPSLAKFMFSPPSSTSNNLSSNRVVNFTGRVATFTISGGVLNVDNGSSIDGFNIELTGTRTGTAVTTSFGGYSFPGLPVDGNYTVTASLANRLFTNFNLLPPTSRSFTALSSNVTANFSAKRLAFGTGDLNPLGIASGDLNGDGKLDVAVATTTGSNIHVLLGNGDGTFQTQVAYPAAANPQDVVIADFNGDGKADVASANSFGSNISVFIGNGDGTLKTRVNYTVGSQPSNLSVSDFNNDGKIDLATLGGPNTLSILLGNGDGTFQPAINKTVATAVSSVLPGDLNGDGKADLVLLGFPGSVLVLIGRGDGTFDNPVSYPAANEVVKATLADLNSDGKLDVAVMSRLPNVLTILSGRGDGTFQPGTTMSFPTTPGDLISHDFNGDGKLDLIVAAGGGVGFLSGKGDGTFLPAVFYPAGSFSGSLVAGDFNNDSKLDVITSQSVSEVTVLLNSLTATLPLTIFIEQGTNKAAALDSVTHLRGPFSILNTHNFSADQHTRVILFTSNLGLGQPDSTGLSVRANGVLLTVENVGKVSGVQGLDASCIIVKLPDGLPAGNLPLTVTLHGVMSSNTPILEISP